MISVFIDASVLFSAYYSKTGSSRELFRMIKQKQVHGFLSVTVLEEVERNLQKMPALSTESIHVFVGKYDVFVREMITIDEIRPYKYLIEEKDAHVIAGTVLTRANYLVTLDTKHIDNPKTKESFPFVTILSPFQLLSVARKNLK